MHCNLRTLGLSFCLWTCYAFSATAEVNVNDTIIVKDISYKVVSINATSNTVRVISSQKEDKYSGEITIPETFQHEGITFQVSTVGDRAFENCTELTYVALPSTLTKIGAGAFMGCTNLTHISIPETAGDNYLSFDNSIIKGCSSLSTLVIPSHTTYLTGNAFSGCESLKSVVFRGKNAPNCDYSRDFFDNDQLKNVTVYVPEGCTSVYKNKKTIIGTPSSFANVKTIKEFSNFNDGVAYTNEEDSTMDVLYLRNFKNKQWQPLYVPFAISVDLLTENGLKVAALNDTHQYDNDHDGVADSTKMEFFTLTSGETKPNYPYLIRSVNIKEHAFILPEATVHAAQETSIECSSITQRFTFTGTYNGVSGEEMFNNSYYAMAGGDLKRAADASVSLKPQRWYMQIENKDGSPVEDFLSPVVRFSVDGIDEETTSGIEDCPTASSNRSAYYDMSGRRLADRPTSGLSIHQGKIILIRK